MKREGERLPPFSIAILAGGESSRMGRNKALEMLGDKPVIAHIIDSLEPLSRDVFIVANDVAAYERFEPARLRRSVRHPVVAGRRLLGAGGVPQRTLFRRSPVTCRSWSRTWWNCW